MINQSLTIFNLSFEKHTVFVIDYHSMKHLMVETQGSDTGLAGFCTEISRP